jgi:hypothetical protein
MKILFEDYSFNAAAQQITFNTDAIISLEHLLVITNVTNNVIIYNFADPSRSGTISNNVLTLTFNTTGMSNTDNLQIFLDNTLSPASEESVQYLKKMVQLLTPLSVQDSAQRQRITIDAAPASLSVGTVTNITAFGNVDVRFQFTDAARLTYANGIRKNLQFS